MIRADFFNGKQNNRVITIMQNTPLFSFIMPAYKAEFIMESIDSILGQTVKDLELVVVDDCSPEPVGKIVKSYTDNRLTYYRNKQNLGGQDLVAQWNRCLEYAKGEWMILATDDDIYAPTFLETFIRLHEEHPEADLFRARIGLIDRMGRITDIERCQEEYVSPVHFFYEINAGMKGGVPQHIFRREKIVRNGGFVSFPKAWASDDATAIMLSDNGVLFSQKPLVFFRYSGQNISTKGKYAEEKVQARILYSNWVMDFIPENTSDDAIEKYYAEMIQMRLLSILKVNLLSTTRMVSYFKRVLLIRSWLKQLPMFDTRNKLSIIFRTLLV